MGCLEQLRSSNADPREFMKVASDGVSDAINCALDHISEAHPRPKIAAIPTESLPGGASPSGAIPDGKVIGELLGDSATGSRTAVTNTPAKPEPTIVDRLGLG